MRTKLTSHLRDGALKWAEVNITDSDEDGRMCVVT